MKFLTLVTTEPNQHQLTPEEMKALGEYSQKSIASGVVFLTGAMVRPTKGMKAEMGEGGKVSYTDGPYAESKEFIDGYAILDVPDLEAAKKVVAEFMAVAKCRKIEILPMFDYDGGTGPKRH